MRKGDGDMKEKKRVWFTFNLCEADAFEQYLEKMALQGWFLESVGGAVMRFYRAQPEKRRYAALLVPESSSLIGADDWKAEQLREQCEEAGWIFQCNSIYWQIFYTTDDAAKRRGDMEKERQFQIQKALSWNWSVKFFYPILVVLEIWAVYQYLQNPGKLFADPMQLLLTLLLTGMIISWAATYIRLFRWSHGNMAAIKKGEPLTEQDLKRTLKCKKYTFMGDGILILGVIALAFLSSMEALISFILSVDDHMTAPCRCRCAVHVKLNNLVILWNAEFADTIICIPVPARICNCDIASAQCTDTCCQGSHSLSFCVSVSGRSRVAGTVTGYDK